MNECSAKRNKNVMSTCITLDRWGISKPNKNKPRYNANKLIIPLQTKKPSNSKIRTPTQTSIHTNHVPLTCGKMIFKSNTPTSKQIKLKHLKDFSRS